MAISTDQLLGSRSLFRVDVEFSYRNLLVCGFMAIVGLPLEHDPNYARMLLAESALEPSPVPKVDVSVPLNIGARACRSQCAARGCHAVGECLVVR